MPQGSFARLRLALWLLFCLIGAQVAWAAAPADGAVLLPLGERVVDITGSLDQPTKKRLIDKLKALEDRRGAQIAVVMLPTVGKMGIEAFSNKLFNLWKLGRKGVDDGVLLVVAKEDHRMRIEVGYGLEGAIPDVLAGRIIRERMTPAFREGDYAGGIESAVDALILLVDGEALPEPAPVPLTIPLEIWLLIVAFVVGSVGGVLISARRLGWRGALAVCAVVFVLAALLASGKDALATVAITPLCLLVGGATFGALWMVRVVFYFVLGLIAYCVLLGVLTPKFGGMLWVYALVVPLLLLLLAGVWWMAIASMRKVWREDGRKAFFRRLWILLGVYLLMEFFAGAPIAPMMLLGLLPVMCLPALVVFSFGREGGDSGSGGGMSSGSSGGSSSGSSSGGGFSGGGGSSGGGGASGSW